MPIVSFNVHTLTVHCVHEQVRPSSGTDVYPHMPILRPQAVLFHERRVSNVTFTSVQCLHASARGPHAGDSSDFGLLGEQSSPNGGFPALDADAKFYATRFILGGEIRNCTNKQNKHTIKR